jgi:hypothetical protein
VYGHGTGGGGEGQGGGVEVEKDKMGDIVQYTMKDLATEVYMELIQGPRLR